MKTTGRVTWCCVALLLALTSVSAVQRLNSIDDLRNIDFGGSVPQHSLVLLYWFAHTVDIDSYSILLTFNPHEEYGSHHYGNFANILDRLPQGYKYYTVGNLKDDISRPLPAYVRNPLTLSNEGNRDRIIFSVRNQRIDQVYITQHYRNLDNRGTEYDPDHTYCITTNLLRQIREFSMGGNYQTLLSLTNRFGSNADVSSIINTWGTSLACLGLFLSIVNQRNVYVPQGQYRGPGNRNINETSWNTGSGVNRTPQPLEENSCLWILLGLVLVVVVFLAFASKSPRY